MSADLGGGYTLKDVMEKIDKHNEQSRKNDEKHTVFLEEIRAHVEKTNGRVTRLEKAVEEKADKKEVKKIREYSIGNWARDNPGKFFGGIITILSSLGISIWASIKTLFGG